MPANLPGPYEMEFSIRVATIKHKLRVNTSVSGTPTAGTAFTAIDVNTKSGGTVTATVAMNGLWNFLRLFYTSAVSCEEVVLWKYIPGTTQKTYVSSSIPTSPTGGGTGTLNMAGQVTATFRSGNGSIARIVILEGINSGDSILALVPNSSGTIIQKLAFYVLSADSWVIARDDSFLVSAKSVAYTQNEALYRKRYRRDL